MITPPAPHRVVRFDIRSIPKKPLRHRSGGG
jgi:hypothetical protein